MRDCRCIDVHGFYVKVMKETVKCFKCQHSYDLFLNVPKIVRTSMLAVNISITCFGSNIYIGNISIIWNHQTFVRLKIFLSELLSSRNAENIFSSPSFTRQNIGSLHATKHTAYSTTCFVQNTCYG